LSQWQKLFEKRINDMGINFQESFVYLLCDAEGAEKSDSCEETFGKDKKYDQNFQDEIRTDAKIAGWYVDESANTYALCGHCFMHGEELFEIKQNLKKDLKLANHKSGGNNDFDDDEEFDTDDNDEEWDDPNTYAHCSDWKDEPENCFSCADDDCPLNQG
jgi:hypothetical protein